MIPLLSNPSPLLSPPLLLLRRACLGAGLGEGFLFWLMSQNEKPSLLIPPAYPPLSPPAYPPPYPPPAVLRKSGGGLEGGD